jgi:predicted RND superfamily exporter protein
VAVQARLPQGLWPQGPPDTLIRTVREIAPDSYIASIPRLGRELRTAALGDMSRLGIVALVVVALVVIASFRGDLRRATLACLPVLLGSIWVFGMWGALGRPLDLFCLAAMPIMLGIGIDDGLHAVHGARREAGYDVTQGVISAGHAIVLTSLTTGVGFASLTLSHVPALQNGGLLVSSGVFGCLVATLTVLPALSLTAPQERS